MTNILCWIILTATNTDTVVSSFRSPKLEGWEDSKYIACTVDPQYYKDQARDGGWSAIPAEVKAAAIASSVQASASETVAGMSQTLAAATNRLVSKSVEFPEGEGPITVDDQGHKWITQPDGLGNMMAVQISASPEVSKEVRMARIATKRADLKAVYDQVNADPNPSQAVKVDLLWRELKARAKAAQ
jgi:hypothetical protein